MIIPTTPIPSKFQLLDTYINSADSFANTRDLQIMRKNHNILLAKGIRKNILTQTYRQSIKVFGAVGPGFNRPIFEIPILVSQHTQYLTVKIRGCQSEISSGTPVNPHLYFVAHKIGQRRQYADGLTLEIDTANTSTEADLGNKTGDIPLPMQSIQDNYYYGMQSYILGMYAKTPIVTDGTDKSGKQLADIIGVGSDYYETSAGDCGGAADVGSVAIFDDLTIEPRLITRFDSVLNRYYVDPPFSRLPDMGAEPGVTVREMQGIDLYSICIYEKVLTDFGADHGAL